MNDDRKLRAAILIISQTASQDPSTDKAIPALKNVFDSAGPQWEVCESKIVPDSVLDIQRQIQQFSDSETAVNLVVTSGGTGFAVNDATPEVGALEMGKAELGRSEID